MQPGRKAVWQFLINIHLHCDPAVPLLGIYPRGKKTTYFHTQTCTRMFTATLSLIAPSWNITGDQIQTEAHPHNRARLARVQTLTLVMLCKTWSPPVAVCFVSPPVAVCFVCSLRTGNTMIFTEGRAEVAKESLGG